MAIDPVTLVVVQNGLQQVASEMDLTFERAAFSPVISEGFDRSDGIYSKDNGEVIAQGELWLPIFVGVMQFTTRAVIDHVAAARLEPGDVFIVNDPYCGGTHLMDVKMVKPFFYRGRLWASLSNTGHWPDTGGSVPGGFSTRATEVQQEGLRLPPVKLFREGVMQDDILQIILANIRVPEERIGDIKAQTAALAVGEKRLTALLDRYGEATVTACIAELRRRSEQMMRAHIARIPDGVYAGESFVDSDGVDPDPLAIRLRLRKEGTDLHFDFGESSPPCRGPLNSVIATTKAAVYLAIKHIFPDVPINAGCFEPLHIAEPHNTFLYARYPRPVSGCAAEVSARIAESLGKYFDGGYSGHVTVGKEGFGFRTECAIHLDSGITLQAEAMAATMEASLEVAYQEMAGVEERSNQFMESRRVEYTMSSLEAVGNHLSAIPGRKNLIWMTSGVPAISAETRDPWPENYVTSLRRVAQKLATQGIAMYPVEAAGVPNTVWYNYRRVPAVTLIKHLLDEGKFGRIFHYRAKFLQDWTISKDLPQGGEGLWRLDLAVALTAGSVRIVDL